MGAPEWFGHPGPAVHPALNRLIGEVELPHVTVTLNKSDVERGSPEWEAVEARMHRLLIRDPPTDPRGSHPGKPAGAAHGRPGAAHPGASPLPARVGQALRERGRVRRGERRSQLTLEGYVAQATDEGSEAGDEGAEGEPEAEDGEAAADAGGEDAEGEPPTGDTEGAAAPVAPPVRTSGPGRGRRAGIGEVVIRALDPRLRSAMVVEDGVRRVVINSRYPLYEVRKGDLWYQLETALREVCVTIPEATVPEFERRVNELMAVSVGLAERRRRSRRASKPARSSIWTGD